MMTRPSLFIGRDNCAATRPHFHVLGARLLATQRMWEEISSQDNRAQERTCLSNMSPVRPSPPEQSRLHALRSIWKIDPNRNPRPAGHRASTPAVDAILGQLP